MKKDYTKLHERYSELFKTHLDYMEKTKSMLGAEKLEQIQQGIGASRPRIAGMALNQLQRSSGKYYLSLFTFFFGTFELTVTQPIFLL